MATIDPGSIATQLATAYTQPTQTRLTTMSSLAQAQSTALTKLQSELTTFSAAMSNLSGGSGAVSYSANFSTTGFGTATASATAQAGTYSLFVEQIAGAHQMSFNDLPSVPAAGSGTLTVNQAGGTSFAVNLAAADGDADGTLTQTEIARAINQAAGNQGKVSAMLSTVGGKTQLILASAQTGAASQISLDTSAMPAGALKTSLSAGTELAAARDAIAWLGPQGSGMKIEQASNTFTAVQGVSMTFTQSMAPGAAPLTLTVARDDTATATKLRGFIDAYNALNKVLNELTAKAKDEKSSAGAFVTDAGIRSMRNRLSGILREATGGRNLMSFGVSADRNGVLSLNETKMKDALTAAPDGLQQVLGKTGLTDGAGVLGSFDKYLRSWTSSVDGQIKQRQEGISSRQKQIAERQTRLDDQYNNAYTRYLNQFTQLQTLQAQMAQNNGMFDSLFAIA